MLGTNDPVCTPDGTPPCASSTATPERTVANLLDMAEDARRSGAEVVILTPPPAACKPFCRAHPDLEFAMAVRQAYTERVAEELRHARLPRRVRVADLRSKFTEDSWAAVSIEGLHPNAEGNRTIATFVASRIPRRVARRLD